MSATGVELVDLVARWIHLIAGIMWIGNSLLFNWLDRNLEPAVSRPQTPKPSGIIWLLHSGGFYYVEKTLLDDEQLPGRLHWFKWQAYSTWMSGALLLIVVYYAGGRAALSDPSVAVLTQGQAVLVGAGAIVTGWAIYELCQRLLAPRAPALATAVWLPALVGIAVALTQLLSGRAAFLHTGAMLGTIMAANVFFTIVPSQRALVRAVAERASGPGLAALSARAKRVSIHNNYFTFPVLVLMLSGHFPGLYSGPRSWLALLILCAGGATARHILNVRFSLATWPPLLFGTIAGTVAGLYLVVAMRSPTGPASLSDNGGPVSFEQARHVIDRRCGACHSVSQSDRSFGPAPGGVTFDTPEEIRLRAARILERAVVTRTMPPANKTGVTDEERALLGRWARAAAAPAR